MRARVGVYALLSIFWGFFDDAPVNGDALTFRAYSAIGDYFHPIIYWYLAHATLVLLSAFFLILAIRNARSS